MNRSEAVGAAAATRDDDVMGPFYSGNVVRAGRQVLADLLILLWFGASWLLSVRLREEIQSMLEPGVRAAARLDHVSTQLGRTAEQTGDLPLVGSALADPLRSLAQVTGTLASTGDAQVASLARAGEWVSVGVLATAVAIGLLAWAPPRIRFVRASAQLGGVRSNAGADALLALRAMSSQPVRRLRRIHPDPVAAWRREDAEVVAALAGLELREHGWRYRPASPMSTLTTGR